MLIDTNIFVDHLRGYPPAVKFFETLYTQTDVIFSAITEAELIAGDGCKDEQKKDIVLQFLNRWNKIVVSNQIAVLAGDLARENDIDIPDAIIAATAKVNKAEIVTRNIKDFKNISQLKIRVPY